ncbi:MAG: helix-turn-helix domain-containing protein [Actinomycetia bacterium]|nr:helix-turn-helix domain-containing protein [Actinomycetes bacterium]
MSTPDVAAAIAALVAALQQPAPAPEPADTVQTMLTVAEAAEVLRCSKSMVYALTREGRLPSVKIGQRRLYAAKEVDAFLSGGGTAA